MRMVDVGGNVLRVLDVRDAGGHVPIVLAADAPVVLEHLAFTCVNALVTAALAKRAPERVERLTLGQLPSLQEYRRWARRTPTCAVDDLGHCFDIEDPERVASLLVER